jgi:hypothetical protein
VTSTLIDYNGTGSVPPTTGIFTYQSGLTNTTADAVCDSAVKLYGAGALKVYNSCTQAVHYGTSAQYSLLSSMFIYLTATPTANITIAKNWRTGWTASHQVGLTAGGGVYTIAGATNLGNNGFTNGTYATNGSGHFILNEWMRVDCLVNNGELSIKLYTSVSGGGGIYSTTSPVASLTASPANWGDVHNGNQVGVEGANNSGLRSFLPSGGNMYVDYLQIDDTTAPTPPSPPAPSATSFAGIVRI